MTDSVDVEKVAARLTEAQRNALYYPGRYADPNTIRALRRKGVMQGVSLTNFGLAVKAHLSGESN